MGASKKKKYDPLETTMSLGDHLEELRMRLIYALAGLGLALLVCLFFGRRIILFIQGPYLRVMSRYAPSQPVDPNAASDPNADSDPNAVVTPNTGTTQDVRLRTLGPTQGITSYMKVSLITGLIVASPWVFYHLWMFVAAGLYPNERKYVYMAVPVSVVLFITGALFFMFVVAELSLAFLINVDRWLRFESNWTFPMYVTFITTLMLVFGIAFQTPLAILFLNKAGLVSIKALRRSRKFVVLGIFVVAAMATPPDVVSQVTLAVPLYFLFELGIVLSWFAGRKKKSQDDQQ
ncbi:MAG: twin-arginine translocase subunit TatC [Planctomycetota bacterium]|jgi:sec-independent protein translocase protein TatC